ncbi:MAG TPA: DUF2147 domain-containing protein [Pseudolabrys sp.]|nr:DUF2147 domain-containing protein [Pseudolabrys sp.]
MNRIKFFAACALLIGFAGAASAAEPYGVWLRPSTGSHVRFYDCGGKLCARVIAVTDPARKGEIGKSIMHGAVKSGENTWKGDLTDAGTGKVYSGTVTLQSADALSLQGCIGGFLCQSETWTKVK